MASSLRAAQRSLAKRSDLRLGAAMVRPSLRMVEGPSGTAKAEPRVMQVLLALADAKGRVLSRDDLLRLCWDGRIVGDDAINRAIAEVRRIASVTGVEFGVETVPRVGYRLTGIEWPTQPSPGPEAFGAAEFDRRKLIVGGAVSLAALAGGSSVFLSSRRRAAVDRLIEQGRVLHASGQADGAQRAAAIFKEAIARDSSRADAWGWLAVAAPTDEAARDAADRALQIDAREPNARTILAVQRRDLDDWTRYEAELVSVLTQAPECAIALSYLTLFYQGMGRCKDSLVCNERAIRIEPFNPTHRARRAQKHWIFGDVGRADQVADRAIQLWPRNSTVWNARLVIYAFTGRAPAALAFLDDEASQPPNLTPLAHSAWRSIIEAIATRDHSDIQRAIEVNTAAASQAPGLAANAIMAFSYLGSLDAAYRFADGLLTNRGSIVQHSRRPTSRDLYSSSVWARTQFLFVPACASFRDDPRFPDLCRQTGHIRYWQKRGVWPDAFVRGAIQPTRPGILT